MKPTLSSSITTAKAGESSVVAGIADISAFEESWIVVGEFKGDLVINIGANPRAQGGEESQRSVSQRFACEKIVRP